MCLQHLIARGVMRSVHEFGAVGPLAGRRRRGVPQRSHQWLDRRAHLHAQQLEMALAQLPRGDIRIKSNRIELHPLGTRALGEAAGMSLG